MGHGLISTVYTLHIKVDLEVKLKSSRLGMVPRGPACMLVNCSSYAMSRILPGHFLDLEDVVESDEDELPNKTRSAKQRGGQTE